MIYYYDAINIKRTIRKNNFCRLFTVKKYKYNR